MTIDVGFISTWLLFLCITKICVELSCWFRLALAFFELLTIRNLAFSGSLMLARV